jgi:tetratricopeptide (TPR) repeat protein
VSPQNLSPLYEKHPELWLVLSALILSTAAGIFLFLFRRKALPIIGTFCAFLLLIFPMLGITQSGSQMFADRFTYLAAIPFSILLAAGLSRLKRMRRTVYGALAALLLIFAIQSATYSNVWKSGLSLWSHAVDVDGSRSGAQNNLGIVFLELNDYDRACDCFDKALEIRPEYADALNNRALVRIHNGEYALAVSDLNSALLQNLMSDEDRARMRLSRGMSLENLNETDSAIAEYSFVIDGPNADPVCRLKALQLRAHARLAVGQIGEAKADLSAMLEIPDYSKEFHRKAEMTLSEIKKIPEE